MRPPTWFIMNAAWGPTHRGLLLSQLRCRRLGLHILARPPRQRRIQRRPQLVALRGQGLDALIRLPARGLLRLRRGGAKAAAACNSWLAVM